METNQERKKVFGGYGLANGQGQREHCPGIVTPEKEYVDPKAKGVPVDQTLEAIKRNTREHKNWWKTKKSPWSSTFVQLPE